MNCHPAAGPTFWQVSTEADLLRGEVENLSIDQYGRLTLGPVSSQVYESSAPFLWTVVQGPDGASYIGSGNEGQVLRVDANGGSRVFFDADELEDVKARDVVVFDVKKATAMFDRVVVATGDSNRQCRALAQRVQKEVKASGGRVYGVEGEATGEWLLVDLGDTVVHIMQPAIRQYYNLEELWAPVPKSAKPVKAKEAAIKRALTNKA